jgi:GTP-binding protein Era
MQKSNEPSEFAAGFVAVMGRPNVGKSTLMNALLGQKVAAVSPRPQTTRRQQLGILTIDNAQVVFIDTPGVHQPRHKLGEAMNETAREALDESDVILFIVDASEPPQEEDRLLGNILGGMKRAKPLILALNKVDRLNAEQIDARQGEYLSLIPPKFLVGHGMEAVAVSATQGINLDMLLAKILALLPQGQPFFPEEQLTDFYERDIAADLIREACLHKLRDEVPHGVGVRIDEFLERENGMLYIAATIFVERESQKGIVIGEGGKMLKQIGTAARKEIESMSGRKVFLELRVKVRKNWRDDEKSLKQFGFGKQKG